MRFNGGLETLEHLLFSTLIMVAVVFAAYSLTILDRIVHVKLYSYGLQFSLDWAYPYWGILRVVQISLGLVAAFTLGFTVFTYRKYVYRGTHAGLVTREIEKASVATQAPKALYTPGTSPFLASTSSSIRCPHCEKSFTQPLRMLDFQGDRPRIVSLCPFCNEVISPPASKTREKPEWEAEFLEEKKNNRKQESAVIPSS